MNSTLHEKVVGSVTIEPAEYNRYGSTVSAVLGNTSFKILNGTTQDLRDWIVSDLPPNMQQNLEFDFVPTPGLWNFHETPPYDFDAQLRNLTTAITNNLKSRSTGNVPVNGTAWASKRFVKVRWEWAALPVASLFGSLVLMVATIWKCKKANVHVWKSSALATLLHGVSEGTRELVDLQCASSQIEAMSAKVQVKLSSTRGDARLVAI